MSDSILRDKSKEFAKQIVVLCRDIKKEHREAVLTNQLLLSAKNCNTLLGVAVFYNRDSK